MPFNVYLVNLGKQFPDADKPKVAAAMKVYFDAVVTEYDANYAGANPKQGSSAVTWVDTMPSLTATDLVLYFTRDSGQSVLKHMPNGSKAIPGGGDQGMTFPTKGTPVGSEVYWNTMIGNTAGAAALGFHELMHNKLRMDDATLHGLNAKNKSPAGLSNSPVDGGFKLTDTEKTEMAKHLMDAVTQWGDGITAWYDPLNGHI